MGARSARNSTTLTPLAVAAVISTTINVIIIIIRHRHPTAAALRHATPPLAPQPCDDQSIDRRHSPTCVVTCLRHVSTQRAKKVSVELLQHGQDHCDRVQVYYWIID